MSNSKPSSFAVTCNLLSQYIKGRPLGDLGLEIPPRSIDAPIVKNDAYRSPTTLSLLPGVDVSEGEHVSDRNDTKSQRVGFGLQSPPAADKREPEKSQLTIFYGGKVLVFDNFAADKAKDLMILAGRGNVTEKNTRLVPIAVDEPKMSFNASFVPAASKPPVAAQACPSRPLGSDLPIARKASLNRFLEKRKDRINAKAPYQLNEVKVSPPSGVAVKLEENQPWLGLQPSQSSSSSR